MYSRIHNLSYLLFKCPEKTKQITGDVPPFKFFHSIQWTLPGEAKSKAIQFCTSLFSIHRLADSRENPAWRSKKLSKKGFCFYSLFDTRALDKGIAFPSFFFASSIIYCPVPPPPHTHKTNYEAKSFIQGFSFYSSDPPGQKQKKKIVDPTVCGMAATSAAAIEQGPPPAIRHIIQRHRSCGAVLHDCCNA